MSSRKEKTRERILDTALRLLIEKGYYGVGLEEVAQAAGLSRQAVYLHFKSKADLLVAAGQRFDDVIGTPQRFAAVGEATSPTEALDKATEIWAEVEALVHDAAMLLISVRKSEPDADAAWQDRLAVRLGNARRLLQWLADEGQLTEGWTVDQAAEFVTALLSVHTYDYLVLERGWPPERLVSHMQNVLRAALVRSSAGQ